MKNRSAGSVIRFTNPNVTIPVQPHGSQDPQVASLFQIVGEFFDVVMQPAGEEPKEEDIRSEDEDCQLVPAEEPDDEDLDDAELAAALGAKQASKASCPRGSVESLHTGLTSDLEKVKMTESPGVQIVTPPAHVLAMAEKQQKIQALKYPGVLECLIRL